MLTIVRSIRIDNGPEITDGAKSYKPLLTLVTYSGSESPANNVMRFTEGSAIG